MPYSNRLGYRKFRWKGHDYTTQPNFGDNPHSVHGVGWQRPWEIVSSSVLELVIRLRHPGDADWPFAVRGDPVLHADAAFDACRDGVHQHGRHRAAGGPGLAPVLHEAFARSRLHIELSDRWDSDATQLPVRKVAQPGIDSDISHLDFDNCFDGWHGPARIRDEKFSLQLSSSLDRLVVFTPQDRDYFCVEPVSHVSNAIHMADPAAHGLRTVAAGESFEAWMNLEVAVV